MPYYAPDNLIQTGGVTLATNVTIASTTYTTFLSTTVTTQGGSNLYLRAFITCSNSTTSDPFSFRLTVDGTVVGIAGSGMDGGTLSAGQVPNAVAFSSGPITGLASGTHTIALQWSVTGGTGRCNAASGTQNENAKIEFQEVYV